MARLSSALAWAIFFIRFRLQGLEMGADVAAHVNICDINGKDFKKPYRNQAFA